MVCAKLTVIVSEISSTHWPNWNVDVSVELEPPPPTLKMPMSKPALPLDSSWPRALALYLRPTVDEMVDEKAGLRDFVLVSIHASICAP